VAHRDGNGRGVTIRYGDLLAWLTADVVRPPSAVASSKPAARVDLRKQTNEKIETGNLELLSAARRRRATRAGAAAVSRASDGTASGTP